MDPVLVDLAHAVVATALGRSGVNARIDPLQRTRGAIVLRVTLSDLRRLVLKVADESDRTVDFERTQAVGAVLSLQSVELPSFGEIDDHGQPVGGSLLDALRHRAELRIVDSSAREVFHRLLDRNAGLFTTPQSPTLCHDDLHHGNILFRARSGRWVLAGVLDWDKAWAGPAESDIARMEFWDDMTGPAFWRVYRAAVPAADGYRERSLIYQLLWCLEYSDGSLRHAADTAALAHRLGVASSDIGDSHHLTLQESP